MIFTYYIYAMAVFMGLAFVVAFIRHVWEVGTIRALLCIFLGHKEILNTFGGHFLRIGTNEGPEFTVCNRCGLTFFVRLRGQDHE